MAEYIVTEKGMRMLDSIGSGSGNTLIEQSLPSVDPSVTAQLFSYLESLGTQGGTISDSDFYAMAKQYGLDVSVVGKLLSSAINMGILQRVNTGWRNN